ncbi:MAG: hypothetical protein CMH57_03185 [Myxococcales bacterium]|nr:hypothetical protein [Myxococcales bacterium]
MKEARAQRLLRGASVAALIALALMVWAFLDPRPIAMMAAMTVGQVLGTISLLLFVGVVGVDLLGERLARARGEEPEEGE